jgi:hypothetical protein
MFKTFDFSGSENDTFYGTEGVYITKEVVSPWLSRFQQALLSFFFKCSTSKLTLIFYTNKEKTQKYKISAIHMMVLRANAHTASVVSHMEGKWLCHSGIISPTCTFGVYINIYKCLGFIIFVILNVTLLG